LPYDWALFAEVFEKFEGELVLAHPSMNRLIAESRNKNDKVDSKVLADLLRTIFLARAWIAPREVRDARELVRYRCSLVSYAALAPTSRQSAGVLRHGPITNQGSPWLRWILIEAMQHAVSGYAQLAALHRRVTANQGGRKNAGRIAVARQLLVSIYHMLKRGQPFQPERIRGRNACEKS
jgi:hypothetical protein